MNASQADRIFQEGYDAAMKDVAGGIEVLRASNAALLEALERIKDFGNLTDSEVELADIEGAASIARAAIAAAKEAKGES